MAQWKRAGGPITHRRSVDQNYALLRCFAFFVFVLEHHDSNKLAVYGAVQIPGVAAAVCAVLAASTGGNRTHNLSGECCFVSESCSAKQISPVNQTITWRKGDFTQFLGVQQIQKLCAR